MIGAVADALLYARGMRCLAERSATAEAGCRVRFSYRTVGYPSEPGRYLFVADWIASSLTYRMPTLLWIAERGIWAENLHLYYRLRQSHSDLRLLHEAPGHLFLAHESEDLASFLQVAMFNGWGGYILTEANYVNAFFSHDESIEFFAEDGANLVRKALGNSVRAPDVRKSET